MKIGFFGTPDFAVPSLEALYKENYDIKLVVTQKDRPKGRGKKIQYSPIKERAIGYELDLEQPEDINKDTFIKKIKDMNLDLIVVVAYGQLLGKEILNIPKYGCINLHASLLPKYRGAAPINWALINGEKRTGVAIMEMSEGLDSGDVYSMREIEIGDLDDYPSLYEKLSKIGADLLVETIKKIKINNIKKTPQNHDISTYAPMIFRENGKISWNKKGLDIFNLLRGLKPWPGIYTSYKNQVMKIHEIELLEKNNEEDMGKIFQVSNQGIFVNSLDSTVLIKVIQFPNKRKMSVEEYLKGNDIELGIYLD